MRTSTTIHIGQDTAIGRATWEYGKAVGWVNGAGGYRGAWVTLEVGQASITVFAPENRVGELVRELRRLAGELEIVARDAAEGERDRETGEGVAVAVAFDAGL